MDGSCIPVLEIPKKNDIPRLQLNFYILFDIKELFKVFVIFFVFAACVLYII